MNTDFSLSSLGPVTSLDLSSVQGKNMPQQARIEKVSKAMESIFVSQLTSEMGKSIDGSSDSSEGAEGGPYQDFIQQAMTQGVSAGGGLGLAKIIETSLTQHDHTKATGPMKLDTKNTSYHVNHVE